MAQAIDCLIVGGGPAGLTAAIYAARFRLTVRLLDSGASRATTIPCTRNHAGFPDGISGAELVRRMRQQASKFGARIDHDRVKQVARCEDGFRVEGDTGSWRARAVLLATGVTNRRPPMADDLHAAAIAAGRLRYCPVCDGLEVTDQDVAVIGTGDHGLKEAMFLRTYTAKVALVSPDTQHDLAPDQIDRLHRANIRVLDGPAADFRLDADGLSFAGAGGRMGFEAVYPALGSEVRSELAEALGAKLTADGCILVDAHQRTSVAGLYAAGDVVLGLDQISHAMGQAGVAATAIRNDLWADRQPMR